MSGPKAADVEAAESVFSEPKQSRGSIETTVETSGHIAPKSNCITLIKRRKTYITIKETKIKNSLLAQVGFLELANAGDFAANVFNQIPVPIYAIALMAVGGVFALAMSFFAFRDLALGWRNCVLLRQERRALHSSKANCGDNPSAMRYLGAQTTANMRELGMEVINRVIMDALLGFGAIMIGVGTLMAIGGANHDVFLASNLLSGYIGNVPLAIYAVVNATWCAYIWKIAHHHGTEGAKALDPDGIGSRLKRRVRFIKTYTTLYGATGIFGGIGSLLTATKWEGYVILAPVIVSSIFCNYFWRYKLGFDRPLFQDMSPLDQTSLIRELESVMSIRSQLKTTSETSSSLVWDQNDLCSLIDFITQHGLTEDFCRYLLNCPNVPGVLVDRNGPVVTVDPQDLLNSPPEHIPRIKEIAEKCCREVGPQHFRYQERYLIDLLACYLCTPETAAAEKRPVTP